MDSFAWTCPFCDRDTTIHSELYQEEKAICTLDNDLGPLILDTLFLVCPNAVCKKITLKALLSKAKENRTPYSYGYEPTEQIVNWDLLPQSHAKVFPEYIPQQLRNDYNEACAILKLSPKASATLSRRCLQGMIRDFWDIKNKDSLKKEIDAIEEKVNPLIWQAIQAVREVGNIGAHMEKNVDLIIDVDPDEAEKLISLIEMLFKDWYISHHQREEQLLNIKKIAESKTALKKAGKEPASA